MSRISDVVPLVEGAIPEYLRHDGEPSAGEEQTSETFELTPRIEEVFDGFRAGDEVVTTTECCLLRGEEGVVELDGETSFFEQDGEGWTGPGSIVQSHRTRGEPSHERRQETTQEVTVPSVVGRVSMKPVVGTFCITREALLGIQEDQAAVWAIEVQSPVSSRETRRSW